MYIYIYSIVGMSTVQSVTFAERPSFYREKQCRMYSTFLYVAANTLVEIPYILVSSILFSAPFFFIIGLGENGGDTGAKFLWYWLFVALYLCALIFGGQFLAVACSNQGIAGGN